MASMSGAAPPIAPVGRPGQASDDDPIFTSLIASYPSPSRVWSGARYSLPVHLLVLGLIILVPLFWPEASPDQPDFIKALIYNPPPPPPPPAPAPRRPSESMEETSPGTASSIADPGQASPPRAAAAMPFGELEE
jgi:hypothetical protein